MLRKILKRAVDRAAAAHKMLKRTIGATAPYQGVRYLYREMLRRSYRFYKICYWQDAFPLQQYYTADAPMVAGGQNGKNKLVVCMRDGKFDSPGLCDRLKGIVSLYNLCHKNDVPFRIYWNNPFPLTNYLLPNHYDWHIEASQLTFNKRHAEPLVILHNDHYLLPHVMRSIEVSRKNMRQCHVYTNTNPPANVDFNKCFYELFKFSPYLQNEITRHQNAISQNGKYTDYVSISFRFIGVLGDFEDTSVRAAISPEERDILIEQSLRQIAKIHAGHGCQVLVTSDSSTFLKIAGQRFDYVYTIDGITAHMGVVKNASLEAHVKTFVDLLMISGAKKVYDAVGSGMYSGDFAHTASRIGNRPFERICY